MKLHTNIKLNICQARSEILIRQQQIKNTEEFNISIINEKIVEIFNPLNLFFNAISNRFEAKDFEFLMEMLRKCKYKSDTTILFSGEKFKRKVEFYDYSGTVVIIIDCEGGIVFQILKDGVVGDFITSLDSDKLKSLYDTENVKTVDSLGRMFDVSSFEELEALVKETLSARAIYDDQAELYHKYLRKLRDFRKEKYKFINEETSVRYKQLESLADRYASALRDILIGEKFAITKNLGKKIITPTKNEALSVIFGLYFALMTMIDLDDGCFDDELGIEDKYKMVMYWGIQRELYFFIEKYPDVIDIYIKEFGLKPIEQEYLYNLLNKYQILSGDWWIEPSKIHL